MSAASINNASDAIRYLAEQRRRPARQSAQIVYCGELIIEGGHLGKLGDDLWPTLEQVGIAALDLGRWELAELCVARLNTRFPDSTRVACLQGMLLEAHGELSKALQFYDELLASDETNTMVAKRRIAVIRSLPSTDPRGGLEKTAEALVSYLDVFYADTEAWQELASVYTELNLYVPALFALDELLLLAPHDAFYVLQHAETAHTAGQYTRAYAGFLRVMEMCGPEAAGKGSRDGKAGKREGPWVRSLWGIKACTSELLSNPPSSGSTSSSLDFTPSKLQAIDSLVTELLLNKAYSSSGGGEDTLGLKSTREAARKVLAL